MDVTVVGAGITGLSTALMLKREGYRVAVVEARRIGAVASGHTSAKISLLQGTRTSSLASRWGQRVAQAHLAAHAAGQRWLLEQASAVDCDVETRDTVTYSTAGRDSDGAAAVRREAEVLRRAGLPVRLGTDVGLPFAVSEAVTLPDQAQFDPMPYLAALAAEVHGGGSAVHEQSRVRSASLFGATEVLTDEGRVRSSWVVLATGVPILDRGLFFARVEPSRSYALAMRAGQDLPPHMYLSADSPTRTIRTVAREAGRLLLVGGNGHRVGTAAPMLRHEQDLAAWSAARWPVEEITHRWSAQDYQTEDGLAFIGPMNPTAPKVLIATGFAKWGMTGGTAAALGLTDIIAGRAETNAWLAPMRAARIPRMGAVPALVQANGQVARHLVTGWARPDLPCRTPLNDGEGRVEITPRGKVARSRIDGRDHEVGAVCPHLGGIVEWNDAERSWDCPLHASRFTADGTVLEGPATVGLGDPPGLSRVIRPRTGGGGRSAT